MVGKKKFFYYLYLFFLGIFFSSVGVAAFGGFLVALDAIHGKLFVSPPCFEKIIDTCSILPKQTIPLGGQRELKICNILIQKEDENYFLTNAYAIGEE